MQEREKRELLALGRSNPDLFEFERLRAEYNRRHNTCLTYGQFAAYIKGLEGGVKK